MNSRDIKKQDLILDFQKHFGQEPSRSYFSPGRVNLIGEYTDFNGGYVLPAAIDRGTYYAARANNSSCINVYSDAFNEKATIPLSDVGEQVVEHCWSDYVKGALLEFEQWSLLGAHGLDIFVTGDLPRNSGLSSSASFTVGMLFLLNDMWNCGLEKMDLVQIARSVENNFVGLQCGIMDQFAVANGRADHAIRLHCHTLDAEQIPFKLNGYEIVITDSRVPRKLSESSYNQRRIECDAALKILQTNLHLDFLCAASSADLENCEALQADPVIFRRARHVVAENERVQESVRLLNAGELAGFGELMYASHASLRDDFEVSCAELDILVDAARKIPGVLGSRMTGAGFGGCTVSIVATSAVPDFISELSAAYSSATPFEARILRCRTSDGVKRLNNQDSSVYSELNAGPHRRFNPLTQEWVLVSPHRTKRPWQGKQEQPGGASRPQYDELCYLCPGNKRAGGQQNPEYAETFVFDNDFSALLPDTPVQRIDSEPLFKAVSEQGICKVICFSPRHDYSVPDMSLEGVKQVIRVWMNEFQAFRSNPDIEYVQIFENKGEIMGCSNPHPHCQIWASSSLPMLVQQEQNSQRAYFKEHGRPMLLDYVERELALGTRLVSENDHFAIVVPFWAVWPFETMILPKAHCHSIDQFSDDQVRDFADAYRTLTRAYNQIFECEFPYTAGIHQAPATSGNHDAWQLHMHFYPPLLRSATVRKFLVGYEMLATPQRDITAESAAEILRQSHARASPGHNPRI